MAKGIRKAICGAIGCMSAFILLMGQYTLAASESNLVGRATVIDGDTIEVRGERIRLNGIDAPEASQICLDESSRKYRCGSESANALSQFLETAMPVTCVFIERDRYGRFVGECRLANGKSVQEWLVSSGFALDWPKYSDGKYAHFQEYAKKQSRGIWRGEFVAPWDWRAQNQHQTVVEQPLPLVSTEQTGQCLVKGNINSKGVRIFHMPGQSDYQKTRISIDKGEHWFCSAEEALAAGWRPAAH